MATDRTGGPAFPTVEGVSQVMGIPCSPGMSLRDYAAIKLRIPESGTDWLDKMIRKAKRDEFAGQALPAIIAQIPLRKVNSAELAAKASLVVVGAAYEVANAMLTERAKGADDETSA